MQGFFKNITQATIITISLVGLISCGGGGGTDKDTVLEPVLVESSYSDEVNNYFELDPYKEDSDGDGLNDDYEITFASEFLSPKLQDTDGDGIYDGDEDEDNDGLTALQEQNIGTSPHAFDTDLDQLSDNQESQYNTDPLNNDTDGDGLLDGIEVLAGLNPLIADTDGDGLNDRDDITTFVVTKNENALLKINTLFDNVKNFRLTSSTNIQDEDSTEFLFQVSKDANDLEQVMEFTLSTNKIQISDAEIMIYAEQIGWIKLSSDVIVAKDEAAGTISFSLTVEQLLSIVAKESQSQSGKAARSYKINHTSILSNQSLISNLAFNFMIIDHEKVLQNVSTYFSEGLITPLLSNTFKPNSGSRGITYSPNATFNSANYIPDLSGLEINENSFVTVDLPELESADYSITLYFDNVTKAGTIFHQENSINQGHYNYVSLDAASSQPVAISLVKEANTFKTYVNGKLTVEKEFESEGVIHKLSSIIKIGKIISNCDVGNDLEQCVLNKQISGLLLHIELFDEALSIGQLRNTIRAQYSEWLANEDRDLDGLSDVDELLGFITSYGEIIQTNFENVDTDGDSLTDFDELSQRVDINQTFNFLNTKAHRALTTSKYSYDNQPNYYFTVSSPISNDSDNDGISDVNEFDMGSNPYDVDTDDDGLPDLKELFLGTDLTDPDTDGDGLSDSIEFYLSGKGLLPDEIKELLTGHEVSQTIINSVIETFSTLVVFDLDPLVYNTVNTATTLEEVEEVIDYLYNLLASDTTTTAQRIVAHLSLVKWEAELNVINAFKITNLTLAADLSGFSRLNYGSDTEQLKNKLDLLLKTSTNLVTLQSYKAKEILVGILKGPEFEAKNQYQAYGQILGLAIYFVPLADIPPTFRDMTANYSDGDFIEVLADAVSLIPIDSTMDVIKASNALKKISSHVSTLKNSNLVKRIARLPFISKSFKIELIATQLGLNVYVLFDEDELSVVNNVKGKNRKETSSDIAKSFVMTAEQFLVLATTTSKVQIQGLIDAVKRGDNFEIINMSDNVNLGIKNGMFTSGFGVKHWQNGENFILSKNAFSQGQIIFKPFLVGPIQSGKALKNSRKPDAATLVDGKYYLHEAKVGTVSFSKRTKKEIEADCAMLNGTKDFIVNGAKVVVNQITWNLMASGETKSKRRLGISKNAMKALDCGGGSNKAIKLAIHVPNAGQVSPAPLKAFSIDRATKHNESFQNTFNRQFELPKADISFGYRSLSNVLGVEFMDINFAQCVQSHVNETNVTNLNQLTALDCSNWDVNNVNELSYMTGLVRLELQNNSITEIQLENNTSLAYVDLSGNELNQESYDYLSSIEWITDLMFDGMVDLELRSFKFVVKVDRGQGITFFTNNEFTYNYTVDWGDDTTTGNATGEINHTYDSSGEFNVVVSGQFPTLSFSNYTQECLITEISQWGTNRWGSMRATFNDCESLTLAAIDNPDLSLVTDMASMFAGAKVFNGDVSSWDVSHVTDMGYMFAGADVFNGDVSSWNVSNVIDMPSMFAGAKAFNGDVSSWDVSNVEDMSSLFAQAELFNSNLSAWDVSNVTNMAAIFYSASTFTGNILSWDVSNVTNMSFMFTGTTNFDGNISTWNVSNVTNMYAMFYYAETFNGDISAWDVSSVTTMGGMFRRASIFTGDLSSWDVSKVTEMDLMFAETDNFNSDISSWDVRNVTSMQEMFDEAVAFNGNLSTWDVSSVTDMSAMFARAIKFNSDLSSWNVSSVINMYRMFQGSKIFNSDISSWKVNNVTNMGRMFYGAEIFNGDLSAWDVSNVTDMGMVFRFAHSFKSDLSSWNVSKVTDMEMMFQQNHEFNSDLSAWDVSKVTNMRYMFSQAYVFDSDISAWDVSNVSNMEYMFTSTRRFNSELSNWDVSNVTNMNGMFWSADLFDGDLTSWDVSSVEQHQSFSNGKLIEPLWP